MATTTTPEVRTGSEQSADVERKIQKMRELFADAPVAETRRLTRIGKAVEEFLDKVGDE